MEKVKHIIIHCLAITALLFGCSAIAAGKAKILQAHAAAPPIAKQSKLSAMVNYNYCDDSTHIRVINRSDYQVYVRVPQSGDAYDFPLSPAYQGNNIDYINSDDYYPSLHIIILASDDYTILYDGDVPNCQNVHIDNPYYGTNALNASQGSNKLAIAKRLKVTLTK